MKAFWRNTLLVAGAFIAGGIGGTLYDDGPATMPMPRVPVEQWSLPNSPNAGFAKADAAWKRQSPWSIIMMPEVVVAPPLPPPLVPVELVRTRRSYQAIFIRPGTDEEVHVGPGGRLPDGGRFLNAHRMQVRWIDSDGRRQTRKLLFDPLVQVASPGVVTPGAMPSAPAPPGVIPSRPAPTVSSTPESPSPSLVPLPPGAKSPVK